MTRTFKHRFEPASESPVPGETIGLSVAEIERAGICEVLQTAGARIGAWSILDALLVPHDDAFIFTEPLGHAREVKVAVSGLFGRFVARAYLQRYMGLSFFGHLGSTAVQLEGRSLVVRRKPRANGDLPDWVACCSRLKNLTVAEAKGCHDQDPSRRLKKAFQQAQRVNVLADDKPMDVKRIAVVTRWASKVGGHKIPIISVQDPQDGGDPETASRLDDAGIGIARLHVANMLEPLGFGELAANIRALLHARQAKIQRTVPVGKASVRGVLESLYRITPRHIVGVTPDEEAESGGLIGAYITRSGPLNREVLSDSATRELRDLGLRPIFVGIERDLIKAIIEGDPEKLRNETERQRSTDNENINADLVGTWLINANEQIKVR